MDTKYILTSDGELYHWGIKGMKWGIRRYQNPDGSLTPAGKKRYDDKLGKIEAKTAKIRANQEAKAAVQARKDKMAAAKRELENAKKGKKAEPEKTVESDADKKARLLKNPTAKEIMANKHLFSDNEINALYLRLNNERNINNLIPAQVDKGQQFVDKFTKTTTNISSVIEGGSKAWNSIAKLSNSLLGTELPTISDKVKSKLEKYKEETEWIKAKNDRRKANEDDGSEKPKTELEVYKSETEKIKAENERRSAENTRDEYASGNFSGKKKDSYQDETDRITAEYKRQKAENDLAKEQNTAKSYASGNWNPYGGKGNKNNGSNNNGNSDDDREKEEDED